MSNPYDGREPYQTAWQQGHDYGTQHPSDTQPQAPDFSSWGYEQDVTGYAAQVWLEGALAGRDEAGSGGDAKIQLPDDLKDELTRLSEYYPQSWALYQAGDGEAYLRDVVALAEIPTEDDPVA